MIQNGNVRYQYALFNELPTGVQLTRPEDNWMFSEPISLTTSEAEALADAREMNIERDITRNNKSNRLAVDEATGVHIKIVVRRRLIIELPFENYRKDLRNG